LFKILKKKINSNELNKQVKISFFNFYQKKLKQIQQKLKKLKKIINYLQPIKKKKKIHSNFSKRIKKKNIFIQQQLFHRLLKNQNKTQKTIKQICNVYQFKTSLFSKNLLKKKLVSYF